MDTQRHRYIKKAAWNNAVIQDRFDLETKQKRYLRQMQPFGFALIAYGTTKLP